MDVQSVKDLFKDVDAAKQAAKAANHCEVLLVDQLNSLLRSEFEGKPVELFLKTAEKDAVFMTGAGYVSISPKKAKKILQNKFTPINGNAGCSNTFMPIDVSTFLSAEISSIRYDVEDEIFYLMTKD